MFALVDVNNMYVSCERVFRPALNGRPVVVLSNNDGACIARSNEAKELGVRMAQPWFEVGTVRVATAGWTDSMNRGANSELRCCFRRIETEEGGLMAQSGQFRRDRAQTRGRTAMFRIQRGNDAQQSHAGTADR